MNFQGILIGIGGISRSGKSTLASELARYWLDKGKSVSVFDMDNFVKDEKDIPRIQDRINWEHPASIDTVRLCRSLSTNSVEIAIVDGIFTFIFPWLTERADCLIKLELDEATFYERKSKDHRWGHQPKWYLGHIWKANSKLVSKIEANFVLDGTKTIDYSEICDQLNTFLFNRT